MTSPHIVWFRQDLRLHDQPALLAAAEAGPVIPVYILDDDTPGDWRMGGAQRWWLHHSLTSLAKDLEGLGSRLVLRRGSAVDVLEALIEETGAETIHAIRHYEPWWRKAEEALGDRLCLHDGNHLARPELVTTGSGKPFRIYSAFWKGLQGHVPPEHPLDPPKTLSAPTKWPKSETLNDWDLLPTKPDWATGFDADWVPGEAAARERMADFVEKAAAYDTARNMPSEEGSSRLSPHLHFGEVSARAVWHALDRTAETETFRKELAWRDFTDGVVMAIPDYADRNGRDAFDKMPWRKGAEAKKDLKAWQTGRTGYPIVDAGMRQLWATGWMHNRVRMITASFLIKHLLIDWREGERWFWDCLIDADYGNNSVNWQWVAGTGIDANMFGRIMAPLSQSEKFDAGDYIREWVPELKGLSDAAIHDPDEAGCRPKDYPAKIIGHREGRERALAAGKSVRG
ncbi:cryptochrome/photolyase family protein [Sphingomonas pseudosanguinis]|uniref:Deoxyribodipyrimidine photo-lyase n=1 Tax=Sphingomonas pseudosanguinis TaxID=413712 RepID=A0A7W6F286_9SPHN|nr:deoxyribodipyrimidine photo-lyase [Sphingomonas pseudosanguinis]MBB3878566.1 deoxyribodipyrimidine photo-lyase [Sphingomonas pseudosanguinis]MBN3536181.1 deoxyribodipyrimidine photo-lyase [Sphingomonas pseudosanguinis]